MSARDDGGTAFPFATDRAPDNSINELGSMGMSLRDWFAGQALAGIARSPIGEGVIGREAHIADAARYAYDIADAMLAARKA